MESDFCSMTSDTLLFFNIGFRTKEDLVEICDEGGVGSLVMGCDVAGFKGPYSQVTSDSLSQFSVSGETVAK